MPQTPFHVYYKARLLCKTLLSLTLLILPTEKSIGVEALGKKGVTLHEVNAPICGFLYRHRTERKFTHISLMERKVVGDGVWKRIDKTNNRAL